MCTDLVRHAVGDVTPLRVAGVSLPVFGGVPPHKVCQLAGRVGCLEGSHVRLQQISPLQPGSGRLVCLAVTCNGTIPEPALQAVLFSEVDVCYRPVCQAEHVHCRVLHRHIHDLRATSPNLVHYKLCSATAAPLIQQAQCSLSGLRWLTF